MAVPLVLIGIMIVIAGYRDTYAALGSQVYKDLTGGFLPWIGAMLLVGLIGYVPQYRPFSMTLMALILISVIVSKGGQTFFNNLKSGFTGTPVAPASVSIATPDEIPIMATSKLELEAKKGNEVHVKISSDSGGGSGGGGLSSFGAP